MIRGTLIELGERELCDGSGAICAIVEITLDDARALAPTLYKPIDLAPVVEQPAGEGDNRR